MLAGNGVDCSQSDATRTLLTGHPHRCPQCTEGKFRGQAVITDFFSYPFMTKH